MKEKIIIRHKCGYEWSPRFQRLPKECPYCHEYLKEGQFKIIKKRSYKVVVGGKNEL